MSGSIFLYRGDFLLKLGSRKNRSRGRREVKLKSSEIAESKSSLAAAEFAAPRSHSSRALCTNTHAQTRPLSRGNGEGEINKTVSNEGMKRDTRQTRRKRGKEAIYYLEVAAPAPLAAAAVLVLLLSLQREV